MTLRLIEIVLPGHTGEEVRQLLVEQPVLEVRQIGLREGEVLVRILLEGTKTATRIGTGLWVTLLAALVGMMLLLRKA